MKPTDLTLRDGRAVHLRPTTPADEAELLQAFGRMSEHARYMRLMHVVKEPDVARLRAVLGSFPEAGVGVVATVPADDGIDIVGSAVAIFAADREHCEFAVSVAEPFGGSGLATAIMTTLMDEARAHGMQVMEGYVLSENQPMLRLARRLGFSVGYEPGDASVRVVRKPLAEGA
jgi:acetyltransferase